MGTTALTDLRDYLIFFGTNLTFIVTHLYGWLLKWYYKPKAYSEDFHALFPAQRAVGTFYLLQILELPYLLQVGDADALFYVNAFALLVFALQMLVMCELYFFPRCRRSPRDYWLFALPAAVVLLPLFLKATGLFPLLLPAPEGEGLGVGSPGGWHLWATIAVGVVFAWYFWRNIRMALRIGREVRRVNEATYADTDDFPVRFAQYIQWVPTILLLLLVANFVIDSPVAKAVRDVLFTVASIVFCIYTLNPRRKLYAPALSKGSEELATADDIPIQPADEPIDGDFRLSDDRYDDLRRRLESLLADDRIYTEPHITADMLMQRLGTNANYLTEVIQRSGYTSFYDMVNQHRVRYAIALIRQHPDRRMRDVAAECGFANPTSMNRAFALQGKPAPSTFRQ